MHDVSSFNAYNCQPFISTVMVSPLYGIISILNRIKQYQNLSFFVVKLKRHIIFSCTY